MKKNNKKGFTLVELVIVVAVMAVLVAVAIPTVKSITGTAKTTVADTNARTVESMIKLHEANIETGKVAGVTALTDASLDKALSDAALGIDGYFLYNPANGTVTADSTITALPAAGDVAKDCYGIFFDSDADDAANVVTTVKGTHA